MLGAHPTQGNASSFVLSTLLRRREIRLPLKAVLLSSTQPYSFERILRKAHERVVTKETALPSSPHLAKEESADLLKDLPGFSPVSSASPALQIVALSAGQADLRRPHDKMISLPLTLRDVSDFYRAKHRERHPSSSGVAAVVDTGAPLALIEGKPLHSVERESFDLYCAPGSNDLMIVDIPAASSSEALLWEALFVAECTLREGGSLLALSPHYFSQRVRRFLQWRFHSAHYASAPRGEGHYALCTSLASDFGASSVRRDDFPGFASGNRRRPRRWNPYRREEAKKFVMSMRPGFTNVPHTKDALLRNVAREKERDDALRDADDAFFAVAHGMVEKGSHYSQPND
ncbi:hypothetical protein ABL78_5739 [Leptomonas seymouri]|uniref:Uncharacterized protein n=1 Tax=Leptomonas seymouri TaxID=5684 RepID=A0A0N1HUP8_LEPSE|nr:hypothetical protein ABL78_5739 [Leptomonas seymouri]|eukprot:KPI85194.1 hypothetical protein ABL78_5739 [Leptomonas seymouri]